MFQTVLKIYNIGEVTMKDLVCPYCGFEQDVKDVSDWVNHDGDTTNHEC